MALYRQRRDAVCRQAERSTEADNAASDYQYLNLCLRRHIILYNGGVKVDGFNGRDLYTVSFLYSKRSCEQADDNFQFLRPIRSHIF